MVLPSLVMVLTIFSQDKQITHYNLLQNALYNHTIDNLIPPKPLKSLPCHLKTCRGQAGEFKHVHEEYPDFCIIAHIDQANPLRPLAPKSGTISDRDMMDQVLDDMDSKEKSIH